MARHMLDDADRAAGLQPVEHRAAQRGHLHRLRAERAIADDVMRAGLTDVEQGQGIDVDADFPQHRRQHRPLSYQRPHPRTQ